MRSRSAHVLGCVPRPGTHVNARPPLIFLGNGAIPDSALVGGKAASLLRLDAAGFEVPPFFVLSADAYRTAPDGRVDDTLKAAIGDALTALGEGTPLAVRSSGLAEDSDEFSFAGVFDTVLDVQGLPAVVAAIEQCWRSHRTARADAYRAARRVDGDAGMAVVVQRLVRADWAGVAFSADPLTQALSVTVINASPGLGEDLVSGRVNPVQLRLDAVTHHVLEQERPAGAPDFPIESAIRVGELTQRIATAFGFPQDIEWALESGRLYVLQSRPITTIAGVFHNRALEPWAGQGNPDAPGRIWSRAYADEIWTPPVTPLFYDIQNLTTVTTGRIRSDGDRAPLPPDIFKYYRAAPYIDVDVVCRLYAGLPRIARRETLLGLIPAERARALLDARWRGWAWVSRAWRLEISNGRRFGITRNHRHLERAWPAFLDTARALCDVDLATLDDAAIEEHIGAVWQLAGSVAPECEVAVLYYAHDLKLLLTGLLERWCGRGETLYGDVSAGLDRSETVRESDAIWSIAESIRAAGSRATRVAQDADARAFRRSADAVGAGDACRAFDSFLQLHRHRGANYKDFIHPRWGDDPNLLWSHVRSFLTTPGRRPREANAASAVRRRDAQQAALAAVHGLAAGLKRGLLRHLFRWNEIYAGIRDNHRYYYDHVWYLVRRAYLETGRRLTARGLLAEPDQVWFLVRTELAALAAGALAPTVAAARIAVRRREWQETRTRQPPTFLRNGYVGDDAPASPGPGGTVLQGLAASAGQVRGRARVLADVSELGRLQPGEILVARQTDPGWTPAFSRIAGLVLETGGVLAHGASLCREYGLPCVTAVDSACLRIHDGEELQLDGGAGTVQVVTGQSVAQNV